MSKTSAQETVTGVAFDPEIVAYLEAKFPGIHEIKFRELNRVEAQVPAEHIYGEDVAVNQEHVQELADDMNEKLRAGDTSGQVIPVWLGELSDFNKLAIIDGFHRSAAVGTLENPTVYAVIDLDTTWEKIIDERIKAANMHKSVRFSRVIEWVEDAWSRSPWRDKMDASQAFAAATFKAKRSRILDDQEYAEMQEWVRIKCKDWKLSSIAIYSFLSVAAIADPELARETRASDSGHRLEALTPAHLKAIAKALPNKHELQRLVAGAVIGNNLTVTLARALALKLVDAEDLNEAQEILAPGLIDSLQPEYSTGVPGETRGRRMGSSSSHQGSAVGNTAREKELAKALFIDELRISGLSLANLILSGDYIAPPIEDRLQLSSGLTDRQRAMVLRSVGLDDASVWSPREVRDFGDQVTVASDALLPQLVRKSGFKQQEAADILEVSRKRLANDITKGGLRFEPVQQPRRIHEVTVKTVKHEAGLRRKRPAIKDGDAKQPAPAPLRADTLPLIITSYDAKRRQTILFNFVFNLSPFTTAQVLGVSQTEIESILPDLSTNLKLHQGKLLSNKIHDEDL